MQTLQPKHNIIINSNLNEQTRPVCSDAMSYFGWAAGVVS